LLSGVIGGLFIAASLSLANAGIAAAQLVVDQSTRSVTFNNVPVKDGGEILVRGPYRIPIVITGSNSALFNCSLKQDTTNVPEVDALLAFSKALGPYFVEVGAVIGTNRRAWSTPIHSGDTTAAGLVARYISNIDNTLSNEQTGINVAETGMLAELEKMRSAPTSAEYFKNRTYDARLFCNEDPKDKKCARLSQVSPLVANIEALARKYPALERSVETLETTAPTSPDLPSLKALVATSSTIIENADKLIGFAYSVETLIKRVDRAGPAFSCPDTIRITLTTAGKATVSVTPAADPALARAAMLKPLTFSVKARPDWVARPAVGLGFIRAYGASFPKIGTKKLSDTSVAITTSGSTDLRNAFDLTLASTWRGLDFRDRAVPFAIWVPDVSISPDKDVKSFAIGAGVSLWFIKLSYGRSWTKHSVLSQGQRLNGTLTSADELATRDAYGRPLEYWSISLIGIPPFVP